MKKLLLILAVAVSAVALTLFIGVKRTQKSDFINFNIADIKKDKIVDFVVQDKSIIEKDPEIKKLLTKEKPVEGTDQVAVSVASTDDAKVIAEKIKKEYGSSALEKDVEIKVTVSFNDTYFNSQTNLPQMGMTVGWNYLSDTSSTKIAIIDTGVRGTHEDLTGKVLAGYNVLTSSAISANTDSDNNGHGTAMASAAAATANNSKGIAGVAYRSPIIPVKVLGDSGTGLASDAATGI